METSLADRSDRLSPNDVHGRVMNPVGMNRRRRSSDQVAIRDQVEAAGPPDELSGYVAQRQNQRLEASGGGQPLMEFVFVC